MTVRLEPPVAPSVAAGTLLSSLPADLPDDVDAALALAVDLGSVAPMPGAGATRDLWETLATLAAHDLGVARAVEPHLDAVAIRAQAGLPAAPGRWGVFAAEGGDEPLIASETGTGWRLTGVKPWCSLADRLDAALVTAALPDGSRRLFAVALGDDVQVLADAWASRGLAEIPSGPVRFTATKADPVGDAGWYLTRPGFAWGGIGVAACWYGGAVALGRALHSAVSRSDDPLKLMHLGAVDEALQSARRALAEAAVLADTASTDEKVTAKRVRATVARVCEDVLQRVGHALGPAPLALDEQHAKRVADLTVYIRQHHAEKDLASLGAAVAGGDAPW